VIPHSRLYHKLFCRNRSLVFLYRKIGRWYGLVFLPDYIDYNMETNWKYEQIIKIPRLFEKSDDYSEEKEIFQ